MVKPDLAGDADLMPAFLSYPESPAVTVNEPVLTSGDPITVFGTQGAPMVPLGQNDLWRDVGDRMGGELKFITSPSPAEHANKLQTMLAGGDLPDLVQLTDIPHLPKVLESTFADLSEFLSGDNILEYPNLAAIPTWSWEGCVYNGRIYTVPVTRGKLGAIPLVRRDLVEQRGLSLDFSTGEEFRSLCRDMTDPKKNVWAIGQDPAAWVRPVLQMLGGGNEWIEQDGAFTHVWETDEYERALEIVTDMVQVDEVFHPDSFAGGDPQAWFTAGTSVMTYGSYAVWAFQLRQGAGVPGFEVDSFAQPIWEGGGTARHFVSNQPFQFSGISQAPADRVREVLRALDFFAAPFGSEEHLLQHYGVEGVHHTLDGTDPILTDDGTAKRVSPVSTVVSPAPVLYYPGRPDVAQAVHELQGELVPDGIGDPTVGLYSELDTTDGRTLTEQLTELQNDVLAGRKPLADWADGVETWRQGGGDEIRAEYEQAFEQRSS